MKRREIVLLLLGVIGGGALAFFMASTGNLLWQWLGLALGFAVVTLTFGAVLGSPHLTAMVKVTVVSRASAVGDSPAFVVRVLEVRPTTFLYNPALAEGAEVTLYVIMSAGVWGNEFRPGCSLQLHEWNQRLPKRRRWTWASSEDNKLVLAKQEQAPSR